MKVGDLVTLSAAGRKHGDSTEAKPFYRVNWFIQSGIVSPHYSRLLSKYGHWRYEIKKYKKTS